MRVCPQSDVGAFAKEAPEGDARVAEPFDRCWSQNQSSPQSHTASRPSSRLVGEPMSQLDKTISFNLVETPNCSGQLLL